MAAKVPAPKPKDVKLTAQPRHGRKAAVLVLLMAGVAVVTALVHRNVLNSQALRSIDAAVVNSREVGTPSWQSLKTLLRQPIAGVYQPVAMASLMLDSRAGGGPGNLRPYHRTSLALHAINAALAVLLLYLIFGNAWIAALAGLLFGLHPLAVEPLTAVAQRGILLATTLGLLTLILYVRYAPRGGMPAALVITIALLAALLSEPLLMGLPVMLLLLDCWPLRRLGKRAILEKLPWLAVAIYLGWKFVRPEGIGVGLPAAKIPLIVAHNTMFYLRNIFWPADLCPFYPRPEVLALGNRTILLAVCGTALLLLLFSVLARWTAAPLICLGIFLLALLPSAQVIRFGTSIAGDRFAYFPLIGVLLLAAWLLDRLWRKSVIVAVLLSLGVVAIAGAESVVSRAQARGWSDQESLCRSMLKGAPNSAPLHVELSRLLIRTDRVPEGIEHLRTASRLAPNDVGIRHDLAVLLLQRRDYSQAEQELTEVLRIAPDFMPAYAQLSHAMFEQGRVQDAHELLSRAAEMQPKNAVAQFNYGVVLERLDRLPQAIERYERAIELDPQFIDPYNNLSQLLARQGNVAAAAERLRKALEIAPKSARTRTNLGVVLMQMNKRDEAITEFREALKINPGLVSAHYSLGMALAMKRDLAQAAEHLNEAVRLEPNKADAHYELARVLQRMGRRKDAIYHFRQTLMLDPSHRSAQVSLEALTGTRPAGGK